MSKKRPGNRPLVPVAEPRAAKPAPTPSRWKRLVPLAILTTLVAAGLFALIERWLGASHPSQAQSSSNYVDAATCAECHRDVADSFAQTGMSHAISKPVPGSMVEDFATHNTLYNKASGNYYTMIRRGDEYFQQRHQIGFDGKQTNAVAERIDYVIGSGEQARSYLHRSSEGKLIELPVTWYAEKNGYWAMTPGYDNANQKDFHGNVSKDCIFCHDAYPPALPKEVEDSGEPIFPQDLPLGVDCQRCHGPGAEHEKAARTPKANLDLVRATIVNPAHLGRERQLEVCMECHLSTSGSQDSNISLRFNRNIFSYRPGEPLTDYKLYFDSDKQDPQSFGIADAAYRLRMSKCFAQSAMTCLTCHDPHKESHTQEAESHYLQICQSCHQSVKHQVALPKIETCVSCHMPKRRAEYAVHTVLTDHYIQRQKPSRDLLASLTEPPPSAESAGRLVSYYPKRTRENTADQLYLAIAEAEHDADSKRGAASLEAAIRHYAPAEAGFYAALGDAYAKAGDDLKAVNSFDTALQKIPNDHLIIGKLTESLIASGQLDRAQHILEAIADKPPPDTRLLTNLGNVYARQGQLVRAETTLRKAILVDPESGPSYNLLGMVKEHEGNQTDALQLYRTAIRYRPDLAEARNNLARLLVATGSFAEADFQFKAAIAAAPKFAEAHHSYGLFLVATKFHAQAEAQFRESIRLDPNSPTFHSDFADLLASRGATAESMAEYKAALQLDKSFDDANVGLGMLLVRQGNISAGKSYCRAALKSTDQSIVELANSCLRH